VVEDLTEMAEKTDKSLQLFLKAEEHTFWNILLKAIG
jgi:DNA-directed RNA polymerase subunit L